MVRLLPVDEHVHAAHQRGHQRDHRGVAQSPAPRQHGDPAHHGDFGLMIQRSWINPRK